jgi:hypothetical protein
VNEPSQLARRVIVETPYGAKNAAELADNIEYARRAMADCLFRGEAPFLSHLLYTQVLDDEEPSHRRLGMLCGFVWGQCADAWVVYTDRGITNGMRAGIEVANDYHKPVEYRELSITA